MAVATVFVSRFTPELSLYPLRGVVYDLSFEWVTPVTYKNALAGVVELSTERDDAQIYFFE